jgi:hypothetical protein
LEVASSQEDLVVVLENVCATVQGREVGVRWWFVGSWWKTGSKALRKCCYATPNAEARDSFHPSVNIHVPHTS